MKLNISNNARSSYMSFKKKRESVILDRPLSLGTLDHMDDGNTNTIHDDKGFNQSLKTNNRVSTSALSTRSSSSSSSSSSDQSPKDSDADEHEQQVDPSSGTDVDDDASMLPNDQLPQEQDNQLTAESFGFEQNIVIDDTLRSEYDARIQKETDPAKKQGLIALAQFKEVEFSVQKIFNALKKADRTIRLGQEGISNIRKGEVTSSHSWDRVEAVVLVNVNNFTIKYRNEHDYRYSSKEQAPEITHEVSTRLAAYRSAVKRVRRTKLETLKLRETPNLKRSNSRSRLDKTSIKAVSELSDEEKRVQQQASLLRQATRAAAAAIDRVVYNRKSPEGNTIHTFLQKWDSLEKKYKKDPLECVLETRQFLDGMRSYILENRYDEFTAAIQEIDITAVVDLPSMIESSLENAVVAALEDKLKAILAKTTAEGDKTLSNAIAKIKHQNQEFFGIQESLLSSSNWASAIYELGDINNHALPNDKIHTIVSASKAIYDLASLESESGYAILGADDFLPIFIYVLVNSDIERPELTSEYMMHLCDPNTLQGECGYYLTTFMSALHFIKSLAEENDE
eukprot:TRINITY_DN2155_c0_g1_i3.p1 TRINITY_DN2155_c0_g1~~TRINITY_DN2155_c0_g1_i3.p1  ORF type:complete len:568 (+),score=195.37 TRINITY_DN2155_c0_g1_i3:1286-2989(+)